mmetsp:Transcript_46836/g.134922  ORF Transcript_46836/g.134922 Transcript_46836/m.134922 type:complete len:392 (-) Transcript_46836:1881-3056(-)
MKVATLDLLLVVRLTWLAARIRGLQDVAQPGALSAAAWARALRPIVPLAPLTVVALALRQVGAWNDLLQVLGATEAVFERPLDDGATPHGEPRAASHTARRPTRPVAHGAIRVPARVLSTTHRLHEPLGARPAAAARVSDDLSRPRPLAAAAGLIAIVPSRPLGDRAVRRAVAELRLLHTAIARLPEAQGLLRDGADAEAHRETAVARCPWTPRRELAIHFPRVTDLGVADAHLLQAGGARRTPMLRGLGDLPGSPPDAAAAIDGAIGPRGPVPKDAIYGCEDICGASLRLIDHAAAWSAAVLRRLRHCSDPCALAARAGTNLRLPFRPIAQLAIHGMDAVLGAPLRLRQRAITRLSAARARLHDVAASCPQLVARAIAPSRPIAERTVDG